jgi:hypothetical protein
MREAVPVSPALDVTFEILDGNGFFRIVQFHFDVPKHGAELRECSGENGLRRDDAYCEKNFSGKRIHGEEEPNYFGVGNLP